MCLTRMSCAVVFMLALLVPQTIHAAPAPEAEASSARAGITLEPVRAHWPIAREAGGQWGIVGEVVVSHTWPIAVEVQAISVTLRDVEGRLVAHRRYDDQVSLAGLLRVATVETDSARWRPSGTLTFNSDEHAIAFVAELVKRRPASATVRVEFANRRPSSITVPLEVYEPPQRFTWPTVSDGRPWLATATAGTPPHSQGGAILHQGHLAVSQRFAMDLRQIDEALGTHPVGATAKEAYYAWGQPVVSMGSGRVVAVVQDQPDYEIGAEIPPTQHPAGNYVVVQYGPAAFAVFAHLQQASGLVQVGQWVERGQMLALVGNSGSTSEPHLHVHVTDRWSSTTDPVAAFFLSQGVPALFWNAQVYREGVWLPLRGTAPTEFDIVVAGERP